MEVKCGKGESVIGRVRIKWEVLNDQESLKESEGEVDARVRV